VRAGDEPRVNESTMRESLIDDGSHGPQK